MSRELDGIRRDIIEGDRDEDLTLAGGQFGVDGTAQRGEQIPPLRFLCGVETEPVRQPVPALGIQRPGRVAPEMARDLGRYLQDDELVSQAGEPAFALNWPAFCVIAKSASPAARQARSSSSGPVIRALGPRRPASRRAARSNIAYSSASADSRRGPSSASARTRLTWAFAYAWSTRIPKTSFVRNASAAGVRKTAATAEANGDGSKTAARVAPSRFLPRRERKESR
jgi:hypothetical protein